MPLNKTSGKPRHCPALNERISARRCGSERETAIACPADCPYSPFAIANYDRARDLTQQIAQRILEFYKAEVSPAEMAELRRQANLEGKQSPANPNEFLQQLIHFGLAFFRNSAGHTLADRWRLNGFAGLTNDERVAATAYGRAFVSILEVQETAPNGHMWAVDHFHPERGRILLIDRAAAAEVSRFTLLLSWFLPLPHYTRITGVSAIHIARETFDAWKADLEQSFGRARRQRPELTRNEYLASTFHLHLPRLAEIGREWRESLLKNMDFCRAIARYKLKAPLPEILALLSTKPELQAADPVAGDGFDMPLRQFDWLRRSESKALEQDMAAPLRHSESSEWVGGLATLRVYAERLVLETFSRQKYDFASKLLKEWLATKVELEAESIEDLATIMAKKMADDKLESSGPSNVSPWALFASGSTSPEARRRQDSQPVPAHLAREAKQKFYQDLYRNFADERVPMLENATPREASRKPALRPRLIELLKIHIHDLDEVNRQEGLQLSLNWLLDELGLDELRPRS